jgi:hypothetical protein
MTKEERSEKIRTLTHELSSLLEAESPRPRQPMRFISGDNMPPWVRDWLLEQIRNLRQSPGLH